MDLDNLCKLENKILSVAKLVGTKAFEWTFNYDDYDYNIIEKVYLDEIDLSSWFKKCLADADLNKVIEYIQKSSIIEPYKAEIFDYLLDVKKSHDKDKKIDAIFDRFDDIEERLNQIDDRFKIIIDMMDSAKK